MGMLSVLLLRAVEEEEEEEEVGEELRDWTCK